MEGVGYFLEFRRLVSECFGIVGGDCKCIIHHTGEGTWQARACLMSELNGFTSDALCKV